MGLGFEPITYGSEIECACIPAIGYLIYEVY